MTVSHYPDSHAVAPAKARCIAVASIVAVATALTACGGGDEVRPAPYRAAVISQRDWSPVAPQDPAAANAVLMRAISLVGTPYRYGGNTPEGGFDCSGLVNYVYRDMLDLKLPRT
ncbi:MAG: NlpC/P60 family protein, partial [Luteimonas sp.]